LVSGNITGRYVWTAPAGLGKTRLLVCWIKAMIALGFAFSVAICAGRVQELVDIKRELMEGDCPVPEEAIGLWHALEGAEEAPTFTKEEAEAGMYGTRRVLLLTHARMQSGPDVTRWLEYRDQPRDLVIYDESLLATGVWQASYAPVVGQIKELVAGREDAAAAFLRELMETLDAEVSSQKAGGEPRRLELPKRTDPEILEGAGRLARDRGELRSFLQNREAEFRVIVAKNDGAKATIIKPFPTVPLEALPRMVVMDASYPIRTLLKFANRDMLDKALRLKTLEEEWPWIEPGAVKRYDHLTINLMRTKRSGRLYSIEDAEDRDFGGDIVREIATLIREGIPADKPVLVWTFKKSGHDIPDFERRLRRAIGPSRRNVWIDTFGRETASNAYKRAEHVILQGCLELSPEKLAAQYIAETRNLTMPVPSECIDQLNRGEVWHHTYQALQRGCCREAWVDDQERTQAKPMQVWLFTRHHKAIRRELGRVLPGAQWKAWKPVHMAGGLTKEAMGAAVIEGILDKVATEGKPRVSLRAVKVMDPFLVNMSEGTFRRARDMFLEEDGCEWRRKGGMLIRTPKRMTTTTTSTMTTTGSTAPAAHIADLGP
jgi:hypothetical protein